MVDHTILPDRLYSLPSEFVAVFATGSNPSSRTVHSFGGGESAVSLVLCGVPQGSVLRLILILLYCADVTNIAQHHGVTALTTPSCSSFTARLRSAQQRPVDWRAALKNSTHGWRQTDWDINIATELNGTERLNEHLMIMSVLTK